MESSHSYFVKGLLPELHIHGANLPTYFIVISLACCLAVYWSFLRAKQYHLSPETALNINALALGFGFVGARLTHILIEAPRFYLENPGQVFSLTSGGFVFLGGVLSGYLASLIYLRRQATPLLRWHDLFVLPLSLGYGIGRLGCLAAGCCYGKYCELPWGLEVEQFDLVTQTWERAIRHPAPLYASLWELLTLALLVILERKAKSLRPGFIFSVWLILHGIGRLLMESFRADPRGPELFSLAFSSWISLGFVLIGLILFRRPQRKA